MTAFPVSARLVLPVEPYRVEGYRFGQRVRSRVILWARHLGEDIVVQAGVSVRAIGDGQVVWSEIRAGSEVKRNWGGLVVIGHTHRATGKPFFSLYGHLTDLTVRGGDVVGAGQVLGAVAPGLTPENGWWKISHLHFALYVGPWAGQVLPGYKRVLDGRTRMAWWKKPQSFIEQYNLAAGARLVDSRR